MSYIKNVLVKNLTISGLESGVDAVLGDNITTVLSIDYYESIFEPVFAFEILFITNEGVLSDLQLRGTERVSLEIQHGSGTLEFENLVLTSFLQNESESTVNSFTILVHPESVINNQLYKCTKRYDPKVKASSHVENILRFNIKEIKDEMLDIEETANSDGFFGNYWTPFKAIYWLARRAVSGSMPEDGGGSDRVGFLFWMTKTGYKFKSCDTIISDGKKNDVFEYVQNDVISDNPNSDLYNPRFERNENIIGQMTNSVYGEKRKYFNLHTLHDTEEVVFSKSNAKQAHLGDEEQVNVNFELNENPTRTTRVPIMDFTMRMDGTISSGDGEYHPHKVISQSRMRYETLLSKSLRVTVPMNIGLEAGSVINVKLIKSMGGTDNWMSGYYLIKDLRHTVHFTKDGVQCYTYLRLVRDTPGDA